MTTAFNLRSEQAVSIMQITFVYCVVTVLIKIWYMGHTVKVNSSNLNTVIYHLCPKRYLDLYSR
jgi:hypothetical protein